MLTIRQLVRLPLVPVPAGLVPDLGGPRVYGMAALVRSYLRATQWHRPILPVWLPGKANRAYRAGANPARTGRWAGGPERSSWPSGYARQRQQIQTGLVFRFVLGDAEALTSR